MPDPADTPTSIRRLDSTDATTLATRVAAYDDLQIVLASCERLLTILDGDAADEIGVEALWTLALTSYGRCFAETPGGPALAESDLDTSVGEDVVRLHKLLLHLRDQRADATSSPRERYTVGLAQDESGAVNAVAVTSAPTPTVDEGAVRQAGAIAFQLCGVLDERIGELQKGILADAQRTSAEEIAAMDLVEVAAAG